MCLCDTESVELHRQQILFSEDEIVIKLVWLVLLQMQWIYLFRVTVHNSTAMWTLCELK